jgi:MAE_28990/MAE_18760-like HEPN
MEALIGPFEGRAAEIETYLQFLEGLDAVMKSGLPRLGGDQGIVVSVDQQRMLFSGVYLHLYNLVEASITSCLDAVGETAMSGGNWAPNDLGDELRQEWLRHMARTHTEMTPDNRLRKVNGLFEHLVAARPIGAFQIEKGGGGNWDEDQITRIARRVGLNLSVTPDAYRDVKRVIRDDRGAMGLIVDLRNKLAHGSLSFVECGGYDTVQELRQIAERVIRYMREVVTAFAAHIDNHGYLRPEKRPAAVVAV